MMKRATLAAQNEWIQMPDCPGEMYFPEAERIVRAAIAAALDENDEDLVARVGMEIACEVSGNYSERTAKRIIAALKSSCASDQATEEDAS